MSDRSQDDERRTLQPMIIGQAPGKGPETEAARKDLLPKADALAGEVVSKLLGRKVA